MNAQVVRSNEYQYQYKYQSELQKQYEQLPQVLKDLISEYNVMHRTLMKRVLDEYMYVREEDFIPLCAYVDCDNRLYEDVERVSCYVINGVSHFCSDYCASAGAAEMRLYHRQYMRKLAKMKEMNKN